MIKKFKNGKIVLRAEKSDFNEDGTVKEGFYHDDMFMKDLYIESVNDIFYIIDYNTNKVYPLGNLMNPLKWLLDTLRDIPTLALYPLGEENAKEVLKEIEEEREGYENKYVGDGE